MNFNDIKMNLKKDPPGSMWVLIHRKIGLVITWVLINIVPGINPNHVTLSMLLFNITSAIILYNGLINNSIIQVLTAFLIFSFSLTIDCVDGNIARLQKKTSYKGIYYDRVVHNISHPLLLLVVGYGIALSVERTLVLLVFSVAAITSEFSPLEVAVKDVKVSFINQIINGTSKNFDLSKHIEVTKSSTDNMVITRSRNSVIKFSITVMKMILSIEFMYLIVIVDMLTNSVFFLSTVYALVFSVLHFAKGFFANDLKFFLEKLVGFERKKQDNI